jgi:hypothetical protein
MFFYYLSETNLFKLLHVTINTFEFVEIIKFLCGSTEKASNL